MRMQRYEGISGPEHPDFWVYRLDAELWRREIEALYGDDDLATSAEAQWAHAQPPAYQRVVQVVAFDGDAPVGLCYVEMPQRDNLRVAYLALVVDAAHRGRGIGSALFDDAARFAADEGRPVLQTWCYAPLVASGERRLRGTDGEGELDVDLPGVRFATDRGFELRQVETMSRLVLGPQEQLEELAREARAATSEEYEIIQWLGFNPDWVEDLAVLGRAMDNDVPTGGAELEEGLYDEERMRSA